MIAGNLCLISGIDHSITKTATVVDSAFTPPDGPGKGDNLCIFKPISHLTKSVLKIAVEALHTTSQQKLPLGRNQSRRVWRTRHHWCRWNLSWLLPVWSERNLLQNRGRVFRPSCQVLWNCRGYLSHQMLFWNWKQKVSEPVSSLPQDFESYLSTSTNILVFKGTNSPWLPNPLRRGLRKRSKLAG